MRPTYQNLEGHESLSDEQLKHLMAYSLVLAKDQAGCRFLQSQIEREDLFEIVLDATINNFAELMLDPFGNYLVQKLVEKCGDKQLL